MITSNSFYPKLTVPTQLTNNHGTLNDNFLCKLSENTLDTTSGVLTKKLSNTDYKILTKLIANRLKTVLPLLINNDQTRYLKNRFIRENIRLLQDISFFTKQTHTTALFLSIHLEKVFDSLNWNFLMKVLRSFSYFLLVLLQSRGSSHKS